jgi:hypothetical protein
MEIEFSQQIFENSSGIELNENPSNGSRAFSCGEMEARTDRHADGNIAFLHF